LPVFLNSISRYFKTGGKLTGFLHQQHNQPSPRKILSCNAFDGGFRFLAAAVLTPLAQLGCQQSRLTSTCPMSARRVAASAADQGEPLLLAVGGRKELIQIGTVVVSRRALSSSSRPVPCASITFLPDPKMALPMKVGALGEDRRPIAVSRAVLFAFSKRHLPEHHFDPA